MEKRTNESDERILALLFWAEAPRKLGNPITKGLFLLPWV